MFKSTNPATGQEIANYPELTITQIDNRLERAMSSFGVWRQTSISQRAALLVKLADTFDIHKDRLARMVTSEMGKTFVSAIAEVEKCAAAFRHYAHYGPAMLETNHYKSVSGSLTELCWQPLGPILAIMPWNFPLWQVVRFLAPTILAGNVAVLKHASNVQGVAGLIEEMTLVAGAPEGLCQNLAVKSTAVADLIADSRIVAVTLTGSEAAGSAVAEQAGRHLIKVVLELGGSDPFIIMPSASLDEAVRQAVKSRIQNTGQSCICGKRMIVHADIYDVFLEKFSLAMRAVTTGDPMNAATDMGPLSSIGQQQNVLHQIQEGKKNGAKLLFGGEALSGNGFFMSAGIMTDVPLKSSFMREEIFGPVAIVCRAADISDAICIANAIPFGLGSSVWTEDVMEQDLFIRDIEAGMVAINQMLVSSPDTPFGGIKRSGYGRELGPFGLHEFMNLKTVMRPN